MEEKDYFIVQISSITVYIANERNEGEQKRERESWDWEREIDREVQRSVFFLLFFVML